MKNNRNRIIVIGSSGIICNSLKKISFEKKLNFIFIGRNKANLNTVKGKDYLKKIIKNNDKIIFVSAKAPAKTYEDFYLNIEMANNFILAVKNKNIKYIIYISSDAVYGDHKLISEKTATDCSSVHGKMHLTREAIFQNEFKNKICILRPTLIFGKDDTHNGYGPNLFYKLVKNKKDIFLFGRGEEKRDHIYSEKVAEYIIFFLKKEIKGIYNLASGKVLSFFHLATWFKNFSKNASRIKFKKRLMPMPHKGFRAFNVSLINKITKEIKKQSIENDLLRAFRD